MKVKILKYKNISKNINKTIKSILSTKKNIFINIKIIKEDKISYLNKKYRGINKPTDILTFNYKKNRHIGDIVLCPKIMKNKHKKNYWGKIIIHGVLHILNYDHNEKTDYMIMKEIELKIGMSGIEPPTITTSK